MSRLQFYGFVIFSLILSLHSSSLLATERDGKSLLILALPNDVNISVERQDLILHLSRGGEGNNSNMILPNSTVSVVDSGHVMCCFCQYTGDVLNTIANLTLHNRLKNVIGIAGFIHPSVLQAIQTFRLPTVSLIHFSGVPYVSTTYYMTASTSMLVDSIFALVKSINGNSVGVVTDSQSSYYTRLSRELLSRVEFTNLTVSIDTNDSVINDIVSANAKAVFLSMSASISTQLLCQAFSKGLTWPHYAWIVHRFQFDSLQWWRNVNSDCNSSDIFENVFIVQPTAQQQREDSGSNGDSSRDFQIMNRLNRQLYNAIWALSSLVAVRTDQFSGRSDFDSDNFQRSDTSIYQVLNGSPELVAVFNGTSNILNNLNLNSLKVTEHNVILRRLLPTCVIISTLIVFCFILNTVLMVLYVYFRKEPDIKATSMSLSLLIFVGCYLLVGFAIVSVVWHKITLQPSPLWQLCVVNTWVCGLGVSIPLILATLLVKMLRTYYIFTRHSRIRSKFLTSDCALATYTLLMLSPNVLVLVCWVIIDPFFDDLRNTIYPEFNIAAYKYHCKSHHQIIWFGLLLIFFIALSIALIIVAVKTRKIRMKHFKDTKKVNLLIFLLIFIVVFTLSFWLFFAELYDHIVLIVLSTGHLLAAFLCQILLFIPKLWPALRKKMMCYRLIDGGSSSDNPNIKTVRFAL